MRKYALLFLMLLMVQLGAFAQNPHQTTISVQAKELADATLSGEYETLVNYTYPKVVELMGGKEQMQSMVEQGMEQIRSQGITFVSVTLGTPQQLYKAGKELHCLVPQKVVLKLTAGNLEQESYLLAISQDAGKNWYFLDTTQLTNESTHHLFETFNPALNIPAPKEPVFVEE